MTLILPIILFLVSGYLVWLYIKSRTEEDEVERIMVGFEQIISEEGDNGSAQFWQGSSSVSGFEKLQAFLTKSKVARTLSRYLLQLNTGLNFFEFITLIGVVMLLVGGLTFLRWQRPELMVLSLIAVPLFAWLGLRALAKRRIDKIEMQLPGLVTQMLTTIRSGGTPANALRAAAENTASPLGPSIKVLNETISLGIPPVKAWRQWSNTWYGSRSCDMFSTSIRLKWETGGEMASVLEVILEQLNARRRRELRIRALTAMAKASTYVLIALPIVMGGFTYKVNPKLYHEMLADPIGMKMLYTGAGLIVLGFFWLRHIAKLED